jgi:membrane associated rhomboid family serine protease
MMIFPYADDNSQVKIFPIVTYTLIVLNIIVFAVFQRFGANEIFTNGFSIVPGEILTGKDIISNASSIMHQSINFKMELPALYKTPIPVYLTLITSIFMHGGLAHIAGNMFFLYLYGDNIESQLGHGKYLFFYLLTGVLAGLSHVFATYFQGGSPYIPCLGASGAISGVMGAYLFLFPQNKVRALFLYFPITIPAALSLGIWIVFQVIQGLGILGKTAGGGGVAYAAHIGGFIAGFILISLFTNKGNK